jgi:lipopolysaccharide assembly outer membrane protein LptD (OstA)
MAVWLVAFAPGLQAQQQPSWDFEGTREGGVVYDVQTGRLVATNGVVIRYGAGVVAADRVAVDQQTGDAVLDGNVRIQENDQVWTGEHFLINFRTHQIETDKFRTGKPPSFASGKGMHTEERTNLVAVKGGVTNHVVAVTNFVMTATNAVITPDDIARPLLQVHAKRIVIFPGDKMVASQAVLYVGQVPVFYWPSYTRSLKKDPNTFTVSPGYRSKYGAFLLGTYSWIMDEQLKGAIHLDYRSKRGPGTGADTYYNFGQWGQGSLKYYYTYDKDPNQDQTLEPNPHNRQRVSFNYRATLATNFEAKAVVQYQSDPDMLRDFFEGEYRETPQPATFVEGNRYWSNWNLNAYVQPRLNDYLETVERLPDIRLTGYRQEIARTPLYYESESSAGYYTHIFPTTNGIVEAPAFSAGRVDTYHQVVLPITMFGWLNLTPRVGGRYTYYTETEGLGATNEETSRTVFNTGAELSFKASRVWPGVENHFFDVDGIRHIVQPSLNYAYVPNPSAAPTQLPQFDSQLPSFRLLPIEYTDYNAIDQINSQNVMRFGLHNKLQTKRSGQVVDLINWDVYTDWNLKPTSSQTTLTDLYSDLVIKPRSWLTLGSITRYDIYNQQWRMSLTTLTLQPVDNLRFNLSHLYLRDDLSGSPTALGYGNNIIYTDTMYRLNENWGLGASHYFNLLTGKLQQQRYSIYRDLRSWTAALSFQMQDNGNGGEDYTVAFTFSLKSFPHANRGSEPGGAYWLSGG